jgi:hypothetical protein
MVTTSLIHFTGPPLYITEINKHAYQSNKVLHNMRCIHNINVAVACCIGCRCIGDKKIFFVFIFSPFFISIILC